MIGFVVYALVGLYLVNLSWEFISLPESLSGFNSMITLIGGILLVLGGLLFLTRPRRYGYSSF